MNCRECYREYIDLYYVFDRLGNKHLIARCECRNGAIFLPLVENLDIPIKKTRKQIKEEKNQRKEQPTLF